MEPRVPRGLTLPAAASAAFFLLAPATVAGVVPWRITGWRLQPPLLGVEGGRAAGALLAAAALGVLADCFVRFVVEGRGTPAPPLPTVSLVVRGAYRHTRNPMYLAVVSIVVGQALLFGSVALLEYAAALLAAFAAFVHLYEEPTLRRRHGRQYEIYAANVPRWIPRLSAWPGGSGPRA
jgi:protein-S-isoprenylcysteine O-methyltransferase Ste14